MKKYLKGSIIISFLIIISSFPAKAQFYQIANQLSGLIRPALSGGLNYKGYVELSYVRGLGSRKVDFAGFSTSQGFKYRNWFFMGVGLGLDVAMSHTNEGFGSGIKPGGNSYWDHSHKTTGIMVPVFTDFRANFGGVKGPSFYIDAKIGVSFLMGDSYLSVANGFITSREYFYLKPSAGVRLPIGKNGKTAVDIGITYQLLTSNYWYNSPYNVTLNSLGGTVGFEW